MVPSSFYVPLCATDPVVASDGRSYERSAILSVLRDGNGLSPLTRDPLQATFYPNLALKWRMQMHEQEMLCVASKAVANATRAQVERQRQMEKELGELRELATQLAALASGSAANL